MPRATDSTTASPSLTDTGTPSPNEAAATAGSIASATHRTFFATELWRLVLPVFWLGMLIAIGFLEAPLKFQAPGITIPLGLGIGRLVFGALNVVEGALLIGLTAFSLIPRATRLMGHRLALWAGLAGVYLFKVFIVRPPLNARTDLVLAGAAPGQSIWHYVYIACDGVTMVLLVLAAIGAARAIRTSGARASTA